MATRVQICWQSLFFKEKLHFVYLFFHSQWNIFIIYNVLFPYLFSVSVLCMLLVLYNNDNTTLFNAKYNICGSISFHHEKSNTVYLNQFRRYNYNKKYDSERSRTRNLLFDWIDKRLIHHGHITVLAFLAVTCCLTQIKSIFIHHLPCFCILIVFSSVYFYIS